MMFEAATELLKRFSRKSFGYDEKETQQLKDAIRVLQAAAKVDKLECLAHLLDTSGSYFIANVVTKIGDRTINIASINPAQQIRALLEALPEEKP